MDWQSTQSIHKRHLQDIYCQVKPFCLFNDIQSGISNRVILNCILNLHHIEMRNDKKIFFNMQLTFNKIK